MTLIEMKRSPCTTSFRYIFFYQIPYIPELLLKANDFALLRRAFFEKPMGLANPANLTDEDLEVFKYTFAQEGPRPTNPIVSLDRNVFFSLQEHRRQQSTITVLCWDIDVIIRKAAFIDQFSLFGVVRTWRWVNHWLMPVRDTVPMFNWRRSNMLPIGCNKMNPKWSINSLKPFSMKNHANEQTMLCFFSAIQEMYCDLGFSKKEEIAPFDDMLCTWVWHDRLHLSKSNYRVWWHVPTKRRKMPIFW